MENVFRLRVLEDETATAVNTDYDAENLWCYPLPF